MGILKTQEMEIAPSDLAQRIAEHPNAAQAIYIVKQELATDYQNYDLLESALAIGEDEARYIDDPVALRQVILQLRAIVTVIEKAKLQVSSMRYFVELLYDLSQEQRYQHLDTPQSLGYLQEIANISLKLALLIDTKKGRVLERIFRLANLIDQRQQEDGDGP